MISLNLMKWFIDLFKSNEEEVIDIENDFHHTSARKVESSKGREMETRISYQYPKGEFRFPLVPDDTRETIKHTSSSRERTRRQEQEIEVPIPVSKVKVEPEYKKEKVRIETRGTRPFKPTAIPSPIYGFKGRPEKDKTPPPMENEEKVAGELVTKLADTLITEELVPEVEEIPAAVEPVPEIEEEPTVVEPVTEIEKESAAVEPVTEIEKEPAAVEPVTEIEKEPAAVELVAEIEKEPAAVELVAEVEEEPAAVEPVTEIEKEPAAVEPVTEIEKEPAAVEPVTEIEKEPTVVEPVTEIEEEPAAVEPVTEIEKEPAAVEPVIEIEKEPTVVEPVIEIEEEPTVVELVTESEEEPRAITLELATEAGEVSGAETLDNELEAEDQTVNPEEIPSAAAQINEREAEPAVRKSVIPFNVIMLKHDKRKLPKQSINPSIQSAAEQTENPTLTLVKPESDLHYDFPSFQLLTPPFIVEDNGNWIEELKDILDQTLENFNVGARVVNVTQGPSVTRFEVQPEPGVKVNKITNLSDDIKLSLAARDIRIEAPIPGKHTIGIEVPNKKSRPVFLSEIINNPEFAGQDSPLTAALGLDISGKPIVTDLRKMPHGLIAGATGSGKSVCINTILVSLLYKARPDELKLLLIDPKMVELAPYNRIPHLVSPVITDVKAATAALKWAVEEMDRRYELFAHTGVREIGRFNELAEKHKQYADKLPYIVIVIDELADLMMMSPADVEEAICRIAQKARACGIHLIIATQRPSVDVITGLIKANIPTRIAFSVSSQVDSRTIIDMSGAEKLLGRGDMLFLENGSSKPVRLQGTFVSDEEIDEVVAHVRNQSEPHYLFEQEELLKKTQIVEEEDELFYEACEFVVEHGGASSSSLQRKFKIGYNRAARLIDIMEQQGFISEARGSKPRDVLITEAELETLQEVKLN